MLFLPSWCLVKDLIYQCHLSPSEIYSRLKQTLVSSLNNPFPVRFDLYYELYCQMKNEFSFPCAHLWIPCLLRIFFSMWNLVFFCSCILEYNPYWPTALSLAFLIFFFSSPNYELLVTSFPINLGFILSFWRVPIRLNSIFTL